MIILSIFELCLKYSLTSIILHSTYLTGLQLTSFYGAESGERNYYYQPPLMMHKWELPVLRYHSIRVIYHYPFLGVTFSVILHDFIRQNYHKNQADRYPFVLIMANYPIFPINYHILYFYMYFQCLSFLQKYLNNVSKTCKILQFLEQKLLQKQMFLIFRIVFNIIPGRF